MSDLYVPSQTHPLSQISIPGVPLTYASSMTIDLGGDKIQEVTLAGNLTLACQGHSTQLQVDLIIRADNSSRNLTFDSDWIFVGTKPTAIAANKTARLTFLSPSNTDAKIVCQYAVQT